MVSRGKSYSDATRGTGAVIIGGTSENTDAEDYLSGDEGFENYHDLGVMMAEGTLPKQHDEVMHQESVAPLVAGSPGANSVVARMLSGDDKGFKSPRKRTRDMIVEAEVVEMGGSSPDSVKNKE